MSKQLEKQGSRLWTHQYYTVMYLITCNHRLLRTCTLYALRIFVKAKMLFLTTVKQFEGLYIFPNQWIA